MARLENPFTPRLLRFLAELRDNNHREWFNANKARYEADVREPARELIRTLGDDVRAISPHFVVSDSKVSGSLMRVYRDTRLSPDKTPYKTNVGIQFRHMHGKDAHAPGLYLHIAPDEVFLGAGMWRPDRDALAGVRDALVEHPDTWVAARDDPEFRRTWRLGGESLKRPPRGYPAEHPHLEDLMRKDHIAVMDLEPADVTRPEFADRVADAFARTRPYMAFLTQAVGFDFG